MKQTAVEFLMDKLFDPSTMVQEQIQWFNQAAQMEKEQMCEFADEFAIECINFHHEKTMSTERFFELKYGGNK